MDFDHEQRKEEAVASVEKAVLQRYRAGAQKKETELCCPVEYAEDVLEILPQEIIDKDYGCGNPTEYAREGDHVLDLGSGAGKACYILAQKVGTSGKVIGVDFNDAMLSLARKYQKSIARKLGFANVSFHKAKIQDLRLDLEKAELWLTAHPLRSVEELFQFQDICKRWRQKEPLIPDQSLDLVVSNCVLNLVQQAEKQMLFQEIYRVLKRGGRAVISDIVCDEEPTAEMKADPHLWSGCISGAFLEEEFVQQFEKAGFYGIEILSFQKKPWKVIEGIQFRSMTVRAFKGKEGPCLERKQAITYRGPWKSVVDDDGHILKRGERSAVCDKTFRIMTDDKGPYADQIIPIEPHHVIPLAEAKAFDCRSRVRHPKETKGENYTLTEEGEDLCGCGSEECC